MSQYLTVELKEEIKRVFTPRYKLPLTGLEIEEIARNLVNVMEEIYKFRWKRKYDN